MNPTHHYILGSLQLSKYPLMFHSGCAACNAEDLPTIIEAVKVELEKKSVRRSYAFHAIAVAADRLPGTAIEYLQDFGGFDEVLAGGGWSNHGLLRFVWDVHAGVPEVPQVIVVARRLRVKDGIYSAEREKVIARLIGKGEIRRWYENGLPVDLKGWGSRD